MIFGFINQDFWTNWVDSLLAIISTLGILIAFYKTIWEKIRYWWKWNKYNFFTNNYIIVFGLDENNRVYIDSEIKDGNNKIIIIDQDKDNLYIEKYRNKGLLVEIADSADLDILSFIKVQKAKHIIISTGEDLVNLEIAIQLLQLDSDAKLYINIIDRHLRHFHKEQGIFEGSSVKMYSYFEDASRDLFNKFNIDGNNNTIISSNESYSIAVIGNTNLAYEIISQACIIGQLPNENILKIHCIDKNIQEFKQSIELNYPQIDNIQTVLLQYHSLDINSKDFYENEIWHENMTNIIICLENEQKNLDIASNFSEITYINQIADGDLRTNILFAMFNDYQLTKNIKSNNQVFRNFYTFGSINEINHKNMIINEERDLQAKCVNYIYNNVTPKLLDYNSYLYEYTSIDIQKPINLDVEWNKLGYFKQESNRAVADHIKTKLKYLSLNYEKSNKNSQILYNKNKNIYKTAINDTLRLRLAKNEHQRWITFHILNGFKKIEFISKKEKNELKSFHELKKEHMCLLPFDEFKNKSDELIQKGYELGLFEGYDFMINEHIPFIMAKSGYEILLIKDEEIA